MEACAILDDTVDHTPSVVTERTIREEPELVPLVADLFQTLGSLETWEIGAPFRASSD